MSTRTKDRILHTGAFALGIFGAVSSYISGFGPFIDLFQKNHAVVAAIGYIILLSTIIICAAIFREWQVSRKEKYANITQKLHNISHDIRDIHILIGTDAPTPTCTRDIDAYKRFNDVCIPKFQNVLDDIAGLFEMITGTRCRATVKIVAAHHDSNLYVDTLVRDSNSHKRWGEMDTWRFENNKDPLSQNQQFARMFKEGVFDWHYFSNDLTKASEEFTTTSLSSYRHNGAPEASDHDIRPKRKGLRDRFTLMWRDDEWDLPYKSTITCAIRRATNDTSNKVSAAGSENSTVGFLAIDSESRKVFNENWDVQLCFAFADALFVPLSKFTRIMRKASPQAVKSTKN
jgi:predicted SnoaL-like aldol condensation-catalyzing enzyme